MSPWTAFLESLHSALIDEITERHPEPKPELGLPQRLNRFAIPSTEVEHVVLIEVSFSTSPGSPSRGIALLACQQSFAKAVALKPAQLWDAMLKRATPEFARRRIQPLLSPVQEMRPTDSFPPSILRCARVIWIPIRVSNGQCFFGVGV